MVLAQRAFHRAHRAGGQRVKLAAHVLRMLHGGRGGILRLAGQLGRALDELARPAQLRDAAGRVKTRRL